MKKPAEAAHCLEARKPAARVERGARVNYDLRAHPTLPKQAARVGQGGLRVVLAQRNGGDLHLGQQGSGGRGCEDDSALLGRAHRVFVDLKAAVKGRDDQAIINEVERGADYLKGKFLAAMKNQSALSIRACNGLSACFDARWVIWSTAELPSIQVHIEASTNSFCA